MSADNNLGITEKFVKTHNNGWAFCSAADGEVGMSVAFNSAFSPELVLDVIKRVQNKCADRYPGKCSDSCPVAALKKDLETLPQTGSPPTT